MAEQINVEEVNPKKEKDVDLDLQDAKEQDVEVKEEQKKEDPKLNVGEVDLGYTGHDPKEKGDAKIKVEEVEEKQEEPVEEKKEEPKKEEPVNLAKKKDDYQSRINQLTGRYREAQRRERAALDYAKGLQKKFDTAQKKFDAIDEQHLKELDARVDAQREQVKTVLKDAIEKNDHDKQMEAVDKLTQLGVQKERARLELENKANIKKQQEEENKNVEAKTSSETPPQPKNISNRAKKWAEKNTWFGNDEVMTSAAEQIHKNVVMEGIAVDSDEYYNEIDSRLGNYFPNLKGEEAEQPKKEQKKPVQTVASAGRKQEGRRTVRLTASQVAIAKKLNVPLDEYAKYVKEDK